MEGRCDVGSPTADTQEVGITKAVKDTRARICADLVFVCECLGPGGIQRVVSTLSNEWSSRGRKVCVVTRWDRPFFVLDRSVQHVVVHGPAVAQLDHTLYRSFAVRDLVRGKLGRSALASWWPVRALGKAFYFLMLQLPLRIYLLAMFVSEVRALRRVLTRVDAPIIVSMGTPLNVLTLLAAKGLARRVVISERGDSKAMRESWLWYGMTQKLYGRADLVTANTRALVHHMREFVSPPKLAFLPNPLWVERRRSKSREYDSSLSAPVILSVARLAPEKAPDVLLEGFALYAQACGECRLAFVGRGQLELALKAQAERLGVAHRIDWHGVVLDPLPFYDSAQVFVLVSRIEGTPNALLEAMGCGLPVIVSDGTPGLLEVVEDGVTGLVVPVDDAAALAAALRRLLSDASLRRRLGQAGRERVIEYELSRSIAAWESAIGLPTSACGAA
jgi:GalNAc-alpha-(1->4)-GalNAc-alpha-(1->3)-diNAcBac-PP-undecaprenol alpha-1,4-N-acetyl-D-galactosaminyltransferase